MHRFWDFLEVLLLSVRPKKIVEIGADRGENTVQLLNYCQFMDAHLTIIDPAPQFNDVQLKYEYQKHVDVIKKLSLDALPELEDYDLVLIDGDPNWYTVYNELKQIEKKAIEKGEFPIVCVNNTEWPYGRRDMYHFPQTIPAEFRHPHASKGIIPGSSELIEDGGLYRGNYNALHESGEKNGVLTALEDFLKETELKIHLYRLTYNNGLGILIPDQKELVQLVQYLIM